jgi:hypothetical protein
MIVMKRTIVIQLRLKIYEKIEEDLDIKFMFILIFMMD